MQQYSLSEFNTHIKKVLSQNMESTYWIMAEIGQISVAARGHCYMELVEKDDQFIKAKIRANIWASKFAPMHEWFQSVTGTTLKEGMKILLNGSLTYHEVYGMSLNINDIDATFTLGEREKKKRETLLRLESEGILDMNTSLELPHIVQRFAIISSETAAGYGDFVNQFDNNAYGYVAKYSLYPAVMQGDQAPESIINSLVNIYEREDEYDAVILIRGGGSQIDLDCFDDYNLCAHLAQFPLPIITGIGHERDQSIADEAAHTNLKTPTSVADFLLERMSQYEATMQATKDDIHRSAQMLLRQHSENVQTLNHQMVSSVQRSLQSQFFRIEQLAQRIEEAPVRILKQEQMKIDGLRKLVTASDPTTLFNKGYTLTKLNGKALKDQSPKKGDNLETISSDFMIQSTVEKVKRTPKNKK